MVFLCLDFATRKSKSSEQLLFFAPGREENLRNMAEVIFLAFSITQFPAALSSLGFRFNLSRFFQEVTVKGPHFCLFLLNKVRFILQIYSQ